MRKAKSMHSLLPPPQKKNCTQLRGKTELFIVRRLQRATYQSALVYTVIEPINSAIIKISNPVIMLDKLCDDKQTIRFKMCIKHAFLCHKWHNFQRKPQGLIIIGNFYIKDFNMFLASLIAF